jgi:hypothetical protein
VGREHHRERRDGQPPSRTPLLPIRGVHPRRPTRPRRRTRRHHHRVVRHDVRRTAHAQHHTQPSRAGSSAPTHPRGVAPVGVNATDLTTLDVSGDGRLVAGFAWTEPARSSTSRPGRRRSPFPAPARTLAPWTGVPTVTVWPSPTTRPTPTWSGSSTDAAGKWPPCTRNRATGSARSRSIA